LGPQHRYLTGWTIRTLGVSLFPIYSFSTVVIDVGGTSIDLQIKVSKCGILEPARLSRRSKIQGKSGPSPGGLNPPLWALRGPSSAVVRMVSCVGGEVLDQGVYKIRPRVLVILFMEPHC
jgi:hypothetical protein